MIDELIIIEYLIMACVYSVLWRNGILVYIEHWAGRSLFWPFVPWQFVSRRWFILFCDNVQEIYIHFYLLNFNHIKTLVLINDHINPKTITPLIQNSIRLKSSTFSWNNISIQIILFNERFILKSNHNAF